VQFTVYQQLKDYFLTGEEFEIQVCRDCSLGITTPAPALVSLSRYYNSDAYISHSDTAKSTFDKVYRWIRNYTHKKKYQLINPDKKPLNLLDIGCATGEFLHYCHQQGMQVSGIEPNAKARSFASNTFRLQVGDENELSSYKSESFDCITLWHVLEHVPNITLRLQEIYRLLKPNGLAFIALPNYLSHDARYYGKFWAAWDVPRHLFHFTKTSFSRAAENTGFSLVSIKPMVFDSFYVSMLSHTYKTGVKSFAVPAFVGLISNIKAGFKTGEYSSQIFIIRKGSGVNH